MKLNKALILAGGMGTRLVSVTKNIIPKPLVEVNGKPLLFHAIERLREFDITELYISVGHLHEKIISRFKDGSEFGVKIKWIIEETPLGSGGALYYLKDELKENLVICPADVIFDIDFNRMFSFHVSKNALITLFVHPNTHPFDSDLIISDKDNKVLEINKKNSERNFYYSNLVNAGILIVSPETLSYFKELSSVNLEHDYVNSFIHTSKVFAYKSPEYVKDAGTAERLNEVERDFKSGIIKRKNLRNKQSAVFLDRDGTLNVNYGFINTPEKLDLVEGAIEAVKKINKSGKLAIIITNQSVVARGECTEETLHVIFNKLETLLGRGGAFVDGIYYCPHHPDSGFPGEVKELKIKCDCRKPNIGMLKKAERDFNLDLSSCTMIGDDERDIMTANNANIPSFLIDGKNLDLNKAVELALKV